MNCLFNLKGQLRLMNRLLSKSARKQMVVWKKGNAYKQIASSGKWTGETLKQRPFSLEKDKWLIHHLPQGLRILSEISTRALRLISWTELVFPKHGNTVNWRGSWCIFDRISFTVLFEWKNTHMYRVFHRVYQNV